MWKTRHCQPLSFVQAKTGFLEEIKWVSSFKPPTERPKKLNTQGLVVYRADNAIQRINRYPADKWEEKV